MTLQRVRTTWEDGGGRGLERVLEKGKFRRISKPSKNRKLYSDLEKPDETFSTIKFNLRIFFVFLDYLLNRIPTIAYFWEI